MREKAIDYQLIKPVRVGSPAAKGKVILRRLFKEYFNKLNVGYYDPCCDDDATCPPISAEADNAIECLPDGLYVPPGGGGGGSVDSVELTMPAAFSVSGSPITSTGTLAVTMTGTTTQYLRGDGTVATLPITTANNGLSVSGTTVQLGGALTQATTINSSDATWNITMTGINTSTNSSTLDVSTTGGAGIAIRGTSNSSGGHGIHGVSTNGDGVYGVSSFTGNGIHGVCSVAGYGVLAEATGSNNIAIRANSVNGIVGQFVGNSSSSNVTQNLLLLQRNTSGTAAAGLGASIISSLQLSNGSLRTASNINTLWEDADTATSKARYDITLYEVSTPKIVFSGRSSGAIQLPAYTTNAFTGTPVNSLCVDASGNIIQDVLPPSSYWSSGSANNINNTNLAGVGIGVAITNPLGYLHIAGGTTVFPSLVIGAGVITSTPIDGALEYDSTNLYFTIGSTRSIIPLGTTDTTIYTGDGSITGTRTIDVQGFSVTWNNSGLFRIVEGDSTVGGTYDFNNGVDFLVYDADHSCNLILNPIDGLTFEHIDILTTTVMSSLNLNDQGIKISGISEYADNAAAITGGLTTGHLYRTGDNLKIVH